MVKGFPVGSQWRETVCCNYLDHNKQCNNDLHYCVDHLDGTHRAVSEDLDYFADEATFKEYLPLIMAQAPSDSKTCGLEGYGSELPEIEFAQVDLRI